MNTDTQTIGMSGRVDAVLVAPDGTETPVESGRNTVLYVCADAVARMFVGDQAMRPRNIVFAYATANNIEGAFNFTPGERDNRSRASIVGSNVSTSVVAVADNPRLSSSDATKYTGNAATFSASSTIKKDRYTYGLILEAGDGTVLAVKKFDKPVHCPYEYTMAVSWTITFS